jgi:hypothetical protein
VADSKPIYRSIDSSIQFFGLESIDPIRFVEKRYGTPTETIYSSTNNKKLAFEVLASTKQTSIPIEKP